MLWVSVEEKTKGDRWRQRMRNREKAAFQFLNVQLVVVRSFIQWNYCRHKNAFDIVEWMNDGNRTSDKDTDGRIDEWMIE